MATKKDLSYSAKDSATGAPVAGKFVGQGNALVNSYTPNPAPTDIPTTALIPFAAGEAPLSVSANYQVLDPQVGVDNPSWIRVQTGSGAFTITMCANPYDGMQCTITDVGASAGTNHISVSAGLVHEIEAYPPNGSVNSVGNPAVLNVNGVSVSYRFISGSPGYWKAVATA